MFISFFSLILGFLLIFKARSFESSEYSIEKNLEVSNELKYFLQSEESPKGNLTEVMTTNLNAEILNVKCFWIHGWDVFDMSGLQKSGDNDWSIIAGDSIVYYNFCADVKKECVNSTSPSQMIAYDQKKTCHRMADNSDKMSKFSLIDAKDKYSGLKISLSSGDSCEKGSYTVTYEIECVKNMTKGVIQFSNEKDFTLTKCDNVLKGKSFHSCPLLNFYVISAFFSENNIFFGGFIIVIGLFLLILGAKFIKATIFVVGAISCATVLSVVYFNIFSPETTTAVWIVLSIGVALGLALGWFLIKLTAAFFMILGGCMGYVLGIFLYNLFLNYIHADPKVVYWVTIGSCIVLFSLLALWMVKHVLIFATSICGGYAVVRGASLYFGHFPSENIVLDLVQNKEWDQLHDTVDGIVYAYLSVWLLLAVGGILFQYKINTDKDNDHYRKIDSK